MIFFLMKASLSYWYLKIAIKVNEDIVDLLELVELVNSDLLRDAAAV